MNPEKPQAEIIPITSETVEDLIARTQARYGEEIHPEIEEVFKKMSPDDVKKFILIEKLADKYTPDAYLDLYEAIHDMSIAEVESIMADTLKTEEWENKIEAQKESRKVRVAEAEKARDERHRIKLVQALIKQVGEKYVDTYKTMSTSELEETLGGFGITLEKETELDPYYTIYEDSSTGTNGN